MAKDGKRPHDDAGYRQRRKLLMESITPATRCGRCGRLASLHPQRHKTGRPARWQAGHVVDGNNLGPLVLEWSTCNLSAGGRLGNLRRWGDTEHTPKPVGPHWPGHFDLRNSTAATAAPCLQRTGSLCDGCAAYLRHNPTHR